MTKREVMEARFNYSTIKGLAKDQGRRISDLLALAPQNDPFYVGQESQLRAAEWFADLWQRFNCEPGTHLRRVHYRLVSQEEPVVKPNGTPYENTENDWNTLGNASKWARYLGLVPPTHFVDRRNPEAVINACFQEEAVRNGFHIVSDDEIGSPLVSLPRFADLPAQLFDLPDYETHGYDEIEQPFLVEIWVEKTTMDDVLKPLAARYGVNLVTGAGELSLTAVMEFLKRARAAKRPARILYISDFDPAGLGMPISIARKIEFEQRSNGDGDLEIRLEPLVLTAEQAAQFRLPRTPIKESDRRKGRFELAYGEGATELDALESLYPGRLRRIVEQAILRYYDPSLQDRAVEVEERLVDDLEAERAFTLHGFTPLIDALGAEYQQVRSDYENIRREFASLASKFQPQIDECNARLSVLNGKAEGLNATLCAALARPSINLSGYQIPAANLPVEPTTALYSSRRDYFEQLKVYALQRNGRMGE